jgi:hypothetical protein
MDKYFDSNYIEKELSKIGLRVNKQLKIYLIGGCAMSFRKLKETTKDIDVVVQNKNDFLILSDALFGAQYHQPFEIKIEHEKLEPMKVYENKDGFHMDLFVERVVKKLQLSDSMINRATLYKKYGKLSVYLLSVEDIFLFKGLASEERHRDISDMQILYPRLRWKQILDELNSQKLSNELVALFARRLEVFNKLYLLDVPILQELKKKSDSIKKSNKRL